MEKFIDTPVGKLPEWKVKKLEELEVLSVIDVESIPMYGRNYYLFIACFVKRGANWDSMLHEFEKTQDTDILKEIGIESWAGLIKHYLFHNRQKTNT